MERRRAVTIAAATVATSLGAVAAVAANFGLLGLGTAASDMVGKLDAGRVAESVTPAASPGTAASDPAPNVTVRYEDIYLPAPAATATPAPIGGAPATTAVGDTGSVTAEDPGTAGGGSETGEDHDDHHREGGDHEGEEDEEEADD